MWWPFKRLPEDVAPDSMCRLSGHSMLPIAAYNLLDIDILYHLRLRAPHDGPFPLWDWFGGNLGPFLQPAETCIAFSNQIISTI